MTGLDPCQQHGAHGIGNLVASPVAHGHVDVQALGVRAAVEGNARKAFQAIALDPLTGAMLDLAHTTTADEVLVATEVGMLHQLRAANPRTRFQPVNPRAVCPFMKMTTLQTLADSLIHQTTEIHVPEEIAKPARRAVQRMIEIGSAGRGE